MPVTLPTCPPALDYTPRLISARLDLAPAFGGPLQRRGRLGSRWAFDIRLDNMRAETAREWEMLEVEDDTVVWSIPQPGLVIGSPGSPVVNGAGQSGSQLAVSGFSGGYTMRRGQWLSIVIGGRRYLYRCRVQTSADGSGNMIIPIRPMLRVQPTNGAVVEVADPKIEGWVQGFGGPNIRRRGGMVLGASFTVEERR